MATFFTSKASYQLNLPHEATESLLLAAQKSSHPPPSDFIQARQQVELMLSESLARFVFLNSGNAGPHRKFFSSTCGVSIMGIGLIPVLVSILEHKSRWLRFAAFPFFWMGAVTLVAALHSGASAGHITFIYWMLTHVISMHDYLFLRRRSSNAVI